MVVAKIAFHLYRTKVDWTVLMANQRHAKGVIQTLPTNLS